MQNVRLFEYAENGDLIGVVEVLSRGADINWQNPEWVGQTALHVASANGHTEVVKTLLLHSEIDPNVKDNLGWTPLHGASFYSNLGTVKELLKISQVNYNAKAQDGWTALHSASYSGTKEIVDELLRLPKIDSRAKTDHGYTFLDLAFKMGNSQIINHPSVVEFLLEEVNTLYDQQRLSRILSDTDLAESYRKQANISKRLKNIGSQLRDMETVIDPNLQEIAAILLNERTEFPDFKSKMDESIENMNSIKYQNQVVMKKSVAQENAVVKDGDNFEVGINGLATTDGIDFDDLKNRFQTTYCDDKFVMQYGSELNMLCNGDFGELKTMETNVTSGALVTLSIILVVFAHSCIQWYNTRTTKRTFRELWNIKTGFLTIACGMITWILNRLMQSLTEECIEESSSWFEDSVTKLEMQKDEAKTADKILKEMKIHYEDQLMKLHTVYEARIRECKSEFLEKLEKVRSESERLKTEMARMKKKMSMLAERPDNVEANRVKSIRRGRSLGQVIRQREDSIIFDKTDIIYDQLKKIV